MNIFIRRFVVSAILLASIVVGTAQVPKEPIVFFSGRLLSDVADSTQTFADPADMLKFSLHHFMLNPAFPEFRTYFWKPGDRFFVSLIMPDYCHLDSVISKEEFPDVELYLGVRMPTKMKLRAPIKIRGSFGTKYIFKKKSPNILREITYYFESNYFVVHYLNLDIVWWHGKLARMGGDMRNYVFVYNEVTQTWSLESVKDYGF